MRLGLDKSAAPISPLMENDSWYQRTTFNTHHLPWFVIDTRIHPEVGKNEMQQQSA
jgi:hypothetical protein